MAPFCKSTQSTGSRFKNPGIRTAGFKESSFPRFYQLFLRKTWTLTTLTGWNINQLHCLLGLLNIILRTPSPKSSHRTLQTKFVTPTPRHCTFFRLTISTPSEPSKSEIILSYVPPTRRTVNRSSKFPKQDQDFICKVGLPCAFTFIKEHWKIFSLPVFAPWT